jgi:glycosyl transferase family 25
MSDDIHAYIINLDSATERWKYVEANFRRTEIPFSRIPAVNGRELQLPIAAFSEIRFRLYHGKRTSRVEVACYLSHLECLRAFLKSSHEYAIICEDDVAPQENLLEVLQAAIRYRATWDILRLSGFHNPHPVPFATLPFGHSLSVTFTRLSGAGAYLVDRRVAEILLQKLLPMRVPFDHALDREWFYGLRAASVIPLPVDQNEHGFDTQIDTRTKYRNLGWHFRYLTVLPYRAVNEVSRVGSRIQQLLRAKRLAAKCEPGGVGINRSPRWVDRQTQRSSSASRAA